MILLQLKVESTASGLVIRLRPGPFFLAALHSRAVGTKAVKQQITSFRWNIDSNIIEAQVSGNSSVYLNFGIASQCIIIGTLFFQIKTFSVVNNIIYLSNWRFLESFILCMVLASQSTIFVFPLLIFHQNAYIQILHKIIKINTVTSVSTHHQRYLEKHKSIIITFIVCARINKTIIIINNKVL